MGAWQPISAFARQEGHLFPWAPVCLGADIGTYFALRVEPGIRVLILSGLAAALGF